MRDSALRRWAVAGTVGAIAGWCVLEYAAYQDDLVAATEEERRRADHIDDLEKIRQREKKRHVT